jgi:hypothetical protein
MSASIVALIVVAHERLYQMEFCQRASPYATNAVHPAKRKTAR